MGGVGFCSMGGVGFCSMYGPGFFSTGSNGFVSPCSVGGLGLDSMICEKRVSGEGWGVDEGAAGIDNQIRRTVRMVPTVDTLSVHIASLGKNC